MDTEGARALAARIAAGPPDEDGDPKPESLQDPELETPKDAESETPPEPAAPPESAVEIVHVKPEQAPRREVRIYVRGRDGSLERQP